ncbi:hypothetical protein [Actinoplanes sp. N902-109]|uniref:hypothetical protein n=1 Tax=Actinoplanes sp. (strain N902-109) TaxID=649831 RepID=UPI0003293D53|nr:hypothetical protein [Actinoplanes sp. N902-109]AGL13664.1 hypothetical protein L083_0154 [Actinoplanes sp. N902-109]
MLTFKSTEEQSAWTLAEALMEKGLENMRQAEQAWETFRAGRARYRLDARARGGTEIDGAIRWRETTQAKRALADNEFFMAQASMYNEAAAAQYARALYLKSA